MKKTVLTFGPISGTIMGAMMLITFPLIDKIGFDKAEVIGYTTMLVAFLMVFFGIRSYRENVSGGKITFGKAFAVGILITVVACLCYVIVWEIIYFYLVPDFVDKFVHHLSEKVRASGASQQVIDAETQKMQSFKSMYDNPVINAAITFAEPFPIGLVITLISSAILRRR